MTGRASRRRLGWRYIARMIRAGLISLAVSLATAPVLAQSLDDTRAVNAMRDMARAQERRTDELRQLRQQADDLALQEDRARRNAARDARSLRRFDRP